MSAFSKYDHFAFAPQLKDAFNPCSRDRRKRGHCALDDYADSEWVPMAARKKLRTQPAITASTQEQPPDYSSIAAELAAFQGEPLFKKLLGMSIPQVEYVCQQRTWSVEDVIQLSQALAGEEVTTTACATTLVRHVLFPHASELKTRRIFTSVLQISERPLLEGLAIPLLPTLTRADAQNLTRIPFSAASRISLLRVICADQDLRPWQDPLLLLVEKTLSAQPLLLQQFQTINLATLVQEANMQVLLVLTSKYGQLLVAQQLLDAVETIAQASRQVLKRAVLNHIASIRKRANQVAT